MIKFGTDGWRAIISDEFTFENVRIVAQAVADYFLAQEPKGRRAKVEMAVGYDTRFLSDRYAGLVCEVLLGNGIRVILSDRPIPTPIVSVTIKNRKLSGGVMITASHNPPCYNGIKIKAHFAGSVDPETTMAVEDLLGRNPVRSVPVSCTARNNMLRVLDLRAPYIKYVKSFIDMKAIKHSRLNVALDVMHGTASGYLANCLKNTSVKITAIRQGSDPLFGGNPPEPLSHNLKDLLTLTKKGRFDIGIANDGDGDRIAAVTSSARFLTPGEILSLLIVHLAEDKGMSGGIVKTISNTSLIERVAAHYGLKLYETPVGFKHIAKLMRTEDILIGGEESGGIGVKGYIPERDGTLLALLLLEMMAMRKANISKLIETLDKKFGRFYYLRQDTHYPDELKQKLFATLKSSPPSKLLGSPIKEFKSYDGFKMISKDGFWLLLRLSGTEPILRIYAESQSKRISRQLIELGKKIAHSV